MNEARKVAPTIGCLMIEDLISGGQRLSGLCARMNRRGMRTEIFSWDGRGTLYGGLQNAYYRVRSECDIACIAAWGTGIDAAVALSAQLPVDRMALLEGGAGGEGGAAKLRRSVRRIRRYARRNIAFCTAKVLLAMPESGVPRGRMNRLVRSFEGASGICGIICGGQNKKMCTNDECLPENQIYRFLCTGELPKYLAENSEMCIIYE